VQRVVRVRVESVDLCILWLLDKKYLKLRKPGHSSIFWVNPRKKRTSKMVTMTQLDSSFYTTMAAIEGVGPRRAIWAGCQGSNHVFKVGVQVLGLGYCM